MLIINYNVDFCSHSSYNTIVATKGGGTISEKKKMGRPTDSPKDTMFRVRLDKESEKKLSISADKLQISKSDVVRKGIDSVYDNLEKK